jgi:uncharacterized protein
MASKSKFVISVHDLMHKPGNMRELDLKIDLDEPLGAGLAVVPQGGELDIELRLESVHEGIYVSGDVLTTAEGECSRCLDAVKVPLEVDFAELFAYSLEVEDDFLVVDEKIDLEQVIVDAVVLSLPFTPICSENCQGLCAQCGVKLDENPGHQHEAPIDSRFSELKKLSETEGQD